MNDPRATRPIARSVAIVATALGLWSGLVLLFATPLAVTSSRSFGQAVQFAVSFWGLWLIFIPAVALLAFRFPIERRTLVRNVSLHLVACLLVVVASRYASRPVDSVILRPHRMTPLGPPGFRAAFDALVYWSLLGVCQAITISRRSQERERRAAELEASLTSARLQALRMQINPHFLFNTLNSIAALVYINPRAADEMLGDLSELLRRTLDSMEEQKTTLDRELDFIGAYLRIEQRRFGDRLRLEQSVPEDLRNALVPALILQPLVENAVRHGIEQQPGTGLISIEAKQRNNHLHLIVRDNGRGVTGEEQTSSGRRGIGLANTEARLRVLYGSDQSFSFANAEPNGCRVDIHIPLNR